MSVGEAGRKGEEESVGGPGSMGPAQSVDEAESLAGAGSERATGSEGESGRKGGSGSGGATGTEASPGTVGVLGTVGDSGDTEVSPASEAGMTSGGPPGASARGASFLLGLLSSVVQRAQNGFNIGKGEEHRAEENTREEHRGKTQGHEGEAEQRGLKQQDPKQWGPTQELQGESQGGGGEKEKEGQSGRGGKEGDQEPLGQGLMEGRTSGAPTAGGSLPAAATERRGSGGHRDPTRTPAGTETEAKAEGGALHPGPLDAKPTPAGTAAEEANAEAGALRPVQRGANPAPAGTEAKAGVLLPPGHQGARRAPLVCPGTPTAHQPLSGNGQRQLVWKPRPGKYLLLQCGRGEVSVVSGRHCVPVSLCHCVTVSAPVVPLLVWQGRT